MGLRQNIEEPSVSNWQLVERSPYTGLRHTVSKAAESGFTPCFPCPYPNIGIGKKNKSKYKYRSSMERKMPDELTEQYKEAIARDDLRDDRKSVQSLDNSRCAIIDPDGEARSQHACS